MPLPSYDQAHFAKLKIFLEKGCPDPRYFPFFNADTQDFTWEAPGSKKLASDKGKHESVQKLLSLVSGHEKELSPDALRLLLSNQVLGPYIAGHPEFKTKFGEFQKNAVIILGNEQDKWDKYFSNVEQLFEFNYSEAKKAGIDYSRSEYAVDVFFPSFFEELKKNKPDSVFLEKLRQMESSPWFLNLSKDSPELRTSLADFKAQFMRGVSIEQSIDLRQLKESRFWNNLQNFLNGPTGSQGFSLKGDLFEAMGKRRGLDLSGKFKNRDIFSVGMALKLLEKNLQEISPSMAKNILGNKWLGDYCQKHSEYSERYNALISKLQVKWQVAENTRLLSEGMASRNLVHENRTMLSRYRENIHEQTFESLSSNLGKLEIHLKEMKKLGAETPHQNLSQHIEEIQNLCLAYRRRQLDFYRDALNNSDATDKAALTKNLTQLETQYAHFESKTDATATDKKYLEALKELIGDFKDKLGVNNYKEDTNANRHSNQ